MYFFLSSFPIGHPFTILGKDCKKLIVINEKLYYKGGEVGGLLQLTILCPTDLQYPFFPHESSKNINVYGCCKTCIKERRQTRCPKRHSVDERSLSLVVTVPEYIYSLSLGYELVEMHEALLYRNKAAIFKDFMSFLAREKIRFSKVPSSETAASYAEKINQSLGLTGSWQLKESSFSYNVQMRTFCKTFLNVIAGKFIQSEDGFQTILVHSQVELEKLFWEKKIQSLEMATPDVMQVVIKTTSKKANRSRNVVIGAYILGLSKIKMSEAIKRVEKSGGTPMYSDTGNIVQVKKAFYNLSFASCKESTIRSKI